MHVACCHEACANLEDLSGLHTRGYTTFRRVAPSHELPDEAWGEGGGEIGFQYSSTQFDEPQEGAPLVWRQSFRALTAKEAATSMRTAPRSVLLERLPTFAAAIHERLEHIPLGPLGQPPTMTRMRPVSGEFLRIVPTIDARRGGRVAASHAARPHDWHSDLSYMFWIMLQRTPAHASHSSLHVAPHRRVQQLCALATSRPVRRPASAQREIPCDAGWPTRFFEPLACRLDLRPGDGVLLRPGAFHRTQDDLVPRTAVNFDLCGDSADESVSGCTFRPKQPRGWAFCGQEGVATVVGEGVECT